MNTSQIQVYGWYRLQVQDKEGKTRQYLEFENLITNAGLNRMATGSIVNGCAIGSGTAPPSFGDTQLQTLGQYTTNLTSSQNGLQVSFLPYYGFSRKKYRFNAGTLKEVS